MQLFNRPEHPEINHLTIKLIVGIIATSIAIVTSLLSTLPDPLTSVSESYYAGDWSRSFFVGFLFAISAFLLAYNGHSIPQMISAKVASLAGLGVALFPCGCRGAAEIIPHFHYASAAVMFAILAFFCIVFYRRAMSKRHSQAHWRAKIYLLCCIAILLSMLVLGINAAMEALVNESLLGYFPRLVFYGEFIGLVAFGLSWLVASRVLPVLTADFERHRIVPFGGRRNPGSQGNTAPGGTSGGGHSGTHRLPRP